ncbi:hypothetical protein CRYUN_Cryun20dG0104000 [Craigia yunnanensis]
MAFFRNAKRPLGILLYNTRLSTCSGHGYSTWATKGTSFAQFTDTKASKTACLYWVSRRFSSQAPSSVEQMGLIKQLRERTSAPIKDVKASLVDCNWDIETAQKDLRKRGKVLAMKKSSRTAAEGLLALAQNEGKAAIIELNCETDFVARNEIFEYLVCTVTEVAAMMGENVKLRRGFAMSTSSHGVVSAYLHRSPQPGLGRIAGILSLEVENGNSQLDALQKVGSELAMHIVATKPLFLTKEFVTSDSLNNEREILRSQAESTGKPQMAIEKMVEGRLRKYFEEVVLMEQKYFLNDSLSIKTILDNLSKEVGSPVKIGNFFRMEVGEGIQRLEANADEPVAKAV